MLQLQPRQSAQTALSQVRRPARQNAAQLSSSVPHSHCVDSTGSAEQLPASWVIALWQSAGSTQAVQPFWSGADGWASRPQDDVEQPVPTGLHPR